MLSKIHFGLWTLLGGRDISVASKNIFWGIENFYFWAFLASSGSLNSLQEFAEQCIANIAKRYAETTTVVLAYDIFRKDWSGSQEEPILHAKTLADFWKVDHKTLVPQMRHLLATRDSCMHRRSFASSLDVWLAVLKEERVVNVDQPGWKVLCSFLLAQTQSARHERTFAQVFEIQRLGAIFLQCSFPLSKPDTSTLIFEYCI